MKIQTSTPEVAVSNPESRIPVSDYPARMVPIPPSRMFTIKDALKKYRNKVGADAAVYDMSQGDGGASLPGVPKEILQRAAELQIQHGTGYDKPFGTDQFRQAAADLYWKFEPDHGWGPRNIIFVQGGRDGLQKIYAAMLGTNGKLGDYVVVSCVPWITYNWGPYAAGLNVLRAPGDPNDGWRYTVEGIQACVRYAKEDGRDVAGIVITSPDNPTGRTLTDIEQIELAKAALDAGYPYVLFDWIYHWVTDSGPTNINTILNAFTPEERKKLIFLDGITKCMGASNIRSAQVVADETVIQHMNSQASHGVIPSFFAQAVAIAAFEMGMEKATAGIVEPTKKSRKVLRQALEERGMRFILADGYYAFVELGDYIRAGNFEDSADLGQFMAEEFGIAFVPGIHFSDAGRDWARLSYALPPEKTEKAIQRLFQGLDSIKG